MEPMSLRRAFALLLGAALLAGLAVLTAMPVGAADDEDDFAELKKAFEASGLEWTDEPAEASDPDTDAGSADADGSGVGYDAIGELSGSGSESAKPAASGYEFVVKVLLEDIQERGDMKRADKLQRAKDRAKRENRALTKAERKAATTLTEAERTEILETATREWIELLQAIGLLRQEVDQRGLAEAIEGIRTEQGE